MSKMQRDKGARFERWVRQMFEVIYGTTLSRGQQRSGALQPDVIAPDWWIECTVGQNPRVNAKIRQVKKDLNECAQEHRHKKPLIVHKKDREEVWVTMQWLDFVELLQRSEREALPYHHRNLNLPSLSVNTEDCHQCGEPIPADAPGCQSGTGGEQLGCKEDKQ